MVRGGTILTKKSLIMRGDNWIILEAAKFGETAIW